MRRYYIPYRKSEAPLPQDLGTHQRQIPASHNKARRRIRKSARYWLSSQNLRIGTLNATRDHAVPSANFSGRFKSQSDCTAKGELLREADCFFGQEDKAQKSNVYNLLRLRESNTG